MTAPTCDREVDLREKLAHIDGKATRRGVYGIRNRITGKVYIGSAFNCSKRWSEHRAKLNRGVHHAARLQFSWKKWGADAFEFLFLQDGSGTDNATLLRMEQKWLDSLGASDRERGYNMSPTAGNRAGMVASPETRAKMSAAKAGISQRQEIIAKQSATRKLQCASPEFRAAASLIHKGKIVSALKHAQK